jgi:hypothetical protein
MHSKYNASIIIMITVLHHLQTLPAERFNPCSYRSYGSLPSQLKANRLPTPCSAPLPVLLCCSNMTNFVRKSLHSRTAVYFADGLHNPRKYALKFYADPEACAAERDAYRELQGAGREAQLAAAVYLACFGAAVLPSPKDGLF